MTAASFFTKLGVFVAPSFLDLDTCTRIRDEMRMAPIEEARVGDGYIDENKRKTSVSEVSNETRRLIETRVLALKPRIEEYFGFQLADELERPKFLIYKLGNFFSPHTDRRKPEAEGLQIFKLRRVNVILYLNGESDVPGPDVYGGGQLTLYGLVKRAGWEYYGFPITGAPGLLVAFNSQLLHEVTPTIHGERFNIVTRFLDAMPVATQQTDGANSQLHNLSEKVEFA
jgi:predicted 2-oxoglutarate/Fe(II)-dependent dioxygenase YbiX